jgi:hypothetical protein
MRAGRLVRNIASGAALVAVAGTTIPATRGVWLRSVG